MAVGVGRGDGGDGVEAGDDGGDAGHGGQVHAPAEGVVDLRDKADVGQRDAVAVAVAPRGGGASIASTAARPRGMKWCIQPSIVIAPPDAVAAWRATDRLQTG